MLAAIAAAYAQTSPPPINDLPNPYRTVRDWGKPPGGVPWAAVTAVEVSPDGSIYVIHRCKDNSCAGRPEPPILKFDKSGKLLKAWGENMFVFPHGATVDAQGNLWVTDSQVKDGKGHQVFKFSPDGKVLLTLGKAGAVSAAPGEFDEPTDVVVAPNGNVFVTEGHSGGTTGNDRVEIFDRDGKYLDTWTQWGRPSGILILKDDTMYVADSESFGPDQPGWKKGIRIGSAKTGKIDSFIEDMESTTIEHSGAEGVGVDADGNVYGAVVRRQMLEKHIKK
jgi:sugar lactone lactonase YvrE